MPRIQPQDKTPFDTVQFRMRKDIVAKLYAYAKFLNDSSPSYVVSAALKEYSKRTRTIKNGFPSGRKCWRRL